jgi:hydrogenase maturation protein HypF
MQECRRRLIVTGQVQGVGFRPFVYRLAWSGDFPGACATPPGRDHRDPGTAEQVEAFATDLREKLPPLARILSLTSCDLPLDPSETAFVIGESAPGAGHSVRISPDEATCANCLADMADPANRRHGYPFTNCTDCGPRYTITRSIPYDRATTSMACFPMCPECAAEYADPLNRRFHAQPNACPVCGPRVWLTDAAGATLAEHDPALAALARELAAGRIAAVKGLGGFHLACDAASDAAVATLRERKSRPSKPFAVMVPDLATARRIGFVSSKAAELLSGSVRPIVLLPTREDGPLSRLIGPDTREVGVMLPYTPLHHVLFGHLARVLGPDRIPALVMTSGNAGANPSPWATARPCAAVRDRGPFFAPQPDILVRTDDSVVRPPQDAAGVAFLRRARGYVPSPVPLAVSGPCVLGTGPHLKCTLCLTKADQAFVSQHIGDMENLETLAFYREMLAHLTDILRVTPEMVVCDLHPDYLTTRLALEELGLPVTRLQHHVAHIHAVLAEHAWKPENGPVLGLALDGTGYGEDGTLWGGELLVDVRGPRHERLGHLSPMRLPGGEAAIREPWRIALGMLADAGLDAGAIRPPWPEENEKTAALVAAMLEKNLNCPVSTSCGRLFDAVSALIGVCPRIDHEGQAAIRLEMIQDLSETRAYDCPLRIGTSPAVLDTRTLFAQAARDFARGVPAPVSRRFHLGLMDGLATSPGPWPGARHAACGLKRRGHAERAPGLGTSGPPAFPA